MDARHGLRVSVLVCLLLVVSVSCDMGGSSDQPGELSKGTAAPANAAASQGPTPRPEREEPVPCPSGTMESWTMHERITITESVGELEWMNPGVVVNRTGTATVAWGTADFLIRTADDPPAPGDPQDPAHGAQDTYFAPEDHLAIDAADVQTLMYQKSVRWTNNGFAEIFDLVLSDRVSGSEWSSSLAEVKERILLRADLAVNASGAAVVVWSESKTTRTEDRLYASYRDVAGATWTAPQRVPAPDAFDYDVGIDDAGRVLLVYDRLFDKHEGVWAIRRSRAGEWEKTRQLSGPGTELFGLAVSAGGAAVVTHGHVDGNGRPDGPHFTSRMSPAGKWGAPVGQPNGLGLGGLVDMDAKGRALIAGWKGADLMGRWSRPDGRWRKPFVLTADVSKTLKWGLTERVAVNRRGDAVVRWGPKGRIAHVWARYKPVGQEWTQPVRLTRADKPPQLFRAAIGECGHVAFAWVTSGDPELQVLRASPMP